MYGFPYFKAFAHSEKNTKGFLRTAVWLQFICLYILCIHSFIKICKYSDLCHEVPEESAHFIYSIN